MYSNISFNIYMLLYILLDIDGSKVLLDVLVALLCKIRLNCNETKPTDSFAVMVVVS